MERIDLILEAREERANIIKSYLQNYNILQIKSNIMGLNKNPYYGKLITSIHIKKIINLLKRIKIKDYLIKKYDSIDGNYYLILLNKEVNLKEQLIKIEESEEIGRLVDLDFFITENSIQRKKLRKCLLCDNEAFVCIRNKTHQINELIDESERIVYNKLIEVIKRNINASMHIELSLDPKFGLVTSKTNGSHKDMNYQMMFQSQRIISPYLLEMFKVGYNNKLDNIFKKINKIGIIAEKEMLLYTNGINTYKGLIFCLGLICGSLGYTLKNGLKFNDIFSKIKIIYNKETMNKYSLQLNSFGLKAYQNNFGGIREEASNGFINVQKALCILNKDKITRNDLYNVLIHLIINSEDSVLLKRCKTYDKYLEVKEEFRELENKNQLILNELIYNQRIYDLTSKMIKENISFGGSADLFICTIFLKLVHNELFNIECW